MVTLKDIAQEAGVSIMTVSRVVNGNCSKVSEENARKIQEIVKKLGYIPNSTARSLSSKSSHIISVILRGTENQLKNPYNAAMVGEIVPYVQERGYFLMLHYINKYNDITQRLQAWNTEGSIFIGTFDEDIQQIQQNNTIPLVFTDSYSHVRQVTNVGIDDYKGGELAAKYFIEHGHRSFAFAGLSLASSVVKHRLKGFRDTLEANGFSLSEDHILEETADTAKQICSFKKPVTAIFATADLLAVSLMGELRKLGCVVPDDYSIIGFDDLSISDSVTPRLTTISQNISKKAQLATNILFRHIQDPTVPAENVVMDVQLIERDSVKTLVP